MVEILFIQRRRNPFLSYFRDTEICLEVRDLPREACQGGRESSGRAASPPPPSALGVIYILSVTLLSRAECVGPGAPGRVSPGKVPLLHAKIGAEDTQVFIGLGFLLHILPFAGTRVWSSTPGRWNQAAVPPQGCPALTAGSEAAVAHPCLVLVLLEPRALTTLPVPRGTASSLGSQTAVLPRAKHWENLYSNCN